jgi:hypothetical protein
MQFMTPLISHIEWPKSTIELTFHDSIVMLGSCFAENIGNKLIEHKFHVDLNPFGIIYNPESIALSIMRLIDKKKFEDSSLVFHDGLFHSLSHHGRFSGISKEESLEKINAQLAFSAGNLQNADKLIITFGTSYVYRLRETGEAVANCHKLPSNLFTRQRLSVAEIVDRWSEALNRLFAINRKIIVLFTVSPIRYWQDGVHENQLSKSTLLLAIEELQQLFPARLIYFPAYELMMDELRDYRFYADDLFHPTDLAVEYIWERFVETYMSQQTQQDMKEISLIIKALSHRPFNRQSESYQHFISQTLLKIEQLGAKMPYICFKKEIEALKN